MALGANDPYVTFDTRELDAVGHRARAIAKAAKRSDQILSFGVIDAGVARKALQGVKKDLGGRGKGKNIKAIAASHYEPTPPTEKNPIEPLQPLRHTSGKRSRRGAKTGKNRLGKKGAYVIGVSDAKSYPKKGVAISLSAGRYGRPKKGKVAAQGPGTAANPCSAGVSVFDTYQYWNYSPRTNSFLV